MHLSAGGRVEGYQSKLNASQRFTSRLCSEKLKLKVIVRVFQDILFRKENNQKSSSSKIYKQYIQCMMESTHSKNIDFIILNRIVLRVQYNRIEYTDSFINDLSYTPLHLIPHPSDIQKSVC